MNIIYLIHIGCFVVERLIVVLQVILKIITGHPILYGGVITIWIDKCAISGIGKAITVHLVSEEILSLHAIVDAQSILQDYEQYTCYPEPPFSYNIILICFVLCLFHLFSSLINVVRIHHNIFKYYD